MNLVKLKEHHNISVSIAKKKEVPNKYNDEKCKLTSITAKLWITSLNSHFHHQEADPKMLRRKKAEQKLRSLLGK